MFETLSIEIIFQKNQSVFEWLICQPIKRQDVKFGLIIIKNDPKQKEKAQLSRSLAIFKTIFTINN